MEEKLHNGERAFWNTPWTSEVVCGTKSVD
jgi:hypothetical protein